MSRITAAIQHSSSQNFTSTGRHKSLAKFALPHASKKSRNQSGWLAGWLAKKCQPFFFHELHKNLREICITSKQERQQELADFLCFLLADKCKRG